MKNFQTNSQSCGEPRLIFFRGPEASKTPMQKLDEGNEDKEQQLEDRKGDLIKRMEQIIAKGESLNDEKAVKGWGDYLKSFSEVEMAEKLLKGYELQVERRELEIKLNERKKTIVERMNKIIDETTDEYKGGWEKNLEQFERACSGMQEKIRKSKSPAKYTKKVDSTLDSWENQVTEGETKLWVRKYREEAEAKKKDTDAARSEYLKTLRDGGDNLLQVARKYFQALTEESHIPRLFRRDHPKEEATVRKEVDQEMDRLLDKGAEIKAIIRALEKEEENTRDIEINREMINEELVRKLKLEGERTEKEIEATKDEMVSLEANKQKMEGTLAQRTEAGAKEEDAAKLADLEKKIERADAEEKGPETSEINTVVQRTPSRKVEPVTSFGAETPELLSEEESLNAIKMELAKTMNAEFGVGCTVDRSGNEFDMYSKGEKVGTCTYNLETRSFSSKVEGLDEEVPIEATSNSEAISKVVGVLKENAGSVAKVSDQPELITGDDAKEEHLKRMIEEANKLAENPEDQES